MAGSDSLQNKQISATYKDLLQVPNSNTGVDGTTRKVMDGEGTESALEVSTSAVKSSGTLESTGNLTVGGSLTIGGDAITATPTELNLLDGITAVDADLTSVSASDDTLASAKAVKDYVDSQILTKDNLDEIAEGTTNKHFTATDEAKLDLIEPSADVTDTANVTAAGALMDSELTDLAGVKGVTISTLQEKPSEGAFVDGDKTKLDGIATAATANDTDANLKNRANHTGTQAASTISDFDTEVANNSAVTANTAKETNATHTGDVTGSTALTIADDAVTTAKIADDAVTQAKLADNSVASAQIVAGSILTTDLNDGVITTAKIADDAVTGAKLNAALNDLSNVNASPSDGQVLKWVNASSEWQAGDDAGAAGGISEISEDTTPQLGGDLDVNGNEIITAIGSNGSIKLMPDGSGEVFVGDTAQGLSFHGNVTGEGRITGINEAFDTYKKIKYNASEHEWLLSGNSSKLILDSSGNLGLGTTAPSFASGGGLQVSTDTFSSVRVTETGNTGLDLSQDSSANGYLYLRDNADLIIGTNNTQQMRLTAGGSLGIGGTPAAERLEIINSGADTAPALRISNDAQSWNLATRGDVSDNFVIRDVTGGSNVFTLAAGTGNCGLGTTAPSSIVHASQSTGLNFQANSRAFFGSLHSTHFAVVGGAAKADDSTTSQMVSTETASSGNGLPSAIKLGAGNIDFHTASSSTAGAAFDSLRMRIDSSGYCAIGHSSPDTILHTLTSSDYVAKFESTDGYAAIILEDGGESGSTHNGNRVGVTGDNLHFTTAGTERMRISSSGYLNLQNDYNIQYFNKANGTDRLGWILNRDDNSCQYMWSDGQPLMFGTVTTGGSTTERMRITSDGSVGIGTTVPNEKLVVSGNCSVTGALQITSNTSAPSAGAALYRPASNELGFVTASTERMRITDDGTLDLKSEKLKLNGSGGSADQVLKTDGSGNVSWSALPVELGFAVSDETTALTTGTAKITFRMPHAMTLTAVRANVATAPAGSALTVDIHAGGSTILSPKLTIDAGEKTSTTATTAAGISSSSLADDAEITVDIDAIGSSTAGAGLKIWLIGTRA